MHDSVTSQLKIKLKNWILIKINNIYVKTVS